VAAASIAGSLGLLLVFTGCGHPVAYSITSSVRVSSVIE
jgi:hypothetical protein